MTAPSELPGIETPAPKSARSVFELLRARYEGPAWAFLEEVRNGTGWSKKVTRTADALAMGLWPSRGLHLHGFEVKVSRADWKKELDDPAKAEEIAGYCHFWWLVVDDLKILQNGELPATWGLLVRHGDKLKAEKEPTFNQDAKKPDHSFLAAILRKVQGSTEHALLAQARAEGHAAGQIEGRQWVLDNSDVGRTEKRLEELREKLAAFEKISGIDLQYQGLPHVKKLAGALRLLTGDWNNPLKTMELLEERATMLVDQVREVKREVEKQLPKLRDAGSPTEVAS